MEIEEGGRQARFAGAQKNHDEAASLRADFPMPRQCGIYYYEVTIMSKGKDGRLIGVGFTGPKVPLNRIPGWEPESFAYHGDDGQMFNNNTQGKPFGPKFGTLDVVGCGINFRTGQAFFTRNGVMLGVAFKDLKTDRPYYPTVGMKKTGETLRANFGQDPFAFDINKLVEAEHSSIQSEILQLKPLPDESSLIHSLVSQYLAHDGYVESARDFSGEVRAETRALHDDEDAELGYLEPEEDVDGINRQKIRSAILEGNIDKALKYTNIHYPDVLRENENIYFKLRCRKFIEMIRESSDLNTNIHPPTPPSKRSTASNGHANDDYDFEMELDEQLGVHNGVGQWGADNMDTEDELDDGQTQAEIRLLENKTLEYGAELSSEFANDPRREIKKALEDTFALIAYKNARQSTLAPLLEISGRVPIAEELNSAILVSLGKSSSAALERLYQQSEALVTELTDDGGPGAFINVRRDFLQ
ncbi:SPRY-domain-containing protein [Amniculicola lignicola CBS 123094]|uniref:SPRY-domain-containing protein n=1 Tax=Amniculicola lignicola CBS 123094 TaxID=1392246 RepID=A0A6A5X166_9PLEO|nr:SPRY-domain-containing protein [Amniculicola lignicola CBS 123094]